jgi:hypothetical protein
MESPPSLEGFQLFPETLLVEIWLPFYDEFRTFLTGGLV